ncbi:MAG: thermonuclease family protein [SAR86 cluster bacterium]|jgi:micrococcal nuclease|nr:nuclease [Gammaproteobacteria bacterium]RCL35765.1 MAG: thermonuclease family protein [SAR86 cluster bacterium]URQ69502.1 thermonuclease family protein [SAR86 cluster bacterium]|tara:strand:- start:34 stop:483 length:450 start_codon:yes stop_codon:yes gene_type:complete
MNKLIIFLVFFLLNLHADSYFVTKVIDGDTIEVRQEKRNYKVRLSEIDAPEINQRFGTESKNFLASLILNKEIELIYITEDRYGRIVAKIYKDNKDINRSMVRSGLAWVYDYYVEDQSLYNDQNLAKKNSFNIWSEASPTPPWVFRRSN